MNINDIIAISEQAEARVDEKLVWQTHSDGTETRKIICPRGQKKDKDGESCIPMSSQDMRAARKRSIARAFTLDLKPMILAKAAKRRAKALRHKF